TIGSRQHERTLTGHSSAAKNSRTSRCRARPRRCQWMAGRPPPAAAAKGPGRVLGALAAMVKDVLRLGRYLSGVAVAFGAVLGALIFGVIICGFTFLRLDAYYREMVRARSSSRPWSWTSGGSAALQGG